MAVAQGPFLAAVLLLVSSGLLRSSPLPACTDPCTCQRAPLLNCSSSGLSLVPQPIQDFVTELDLSHNLLDTVTLDRPHHKLRSVWLGNNNITRLSLCIERNLGARHVRGRHLHHLRPRSRQGCVSWAPTLQLLSVERNQLEQLPEGLDGSESLQVLQLSFNRISTLRSTDLNHLRQLVELHLQHNLITSLHPQTFQDLTKLQVLDLSFNKFTSLHPLMYPSLHYIGVDVRLGGNRWQCDCSMRSLRRWMTYDSSRGLQTWSVVCASPSILSGKDLLQLEEDDLNCSGTENRPELHQDVTVYSGSEILLSCSTKDSTWWTPSGQASASNPEAGLLINDITERDTGLYVCVSEEHEVVSVFNLQISKVGGARRKTRSLPRTSQQTIPQDAQNRIGEDRNQGATQSQLALAVCLSILFTFLIAFILGVLARPCIDVFWRRITKKKITETEANSVSSAEQRQYDNEAYSNGEEQEERPEGSNRERRVTFSTVDYRESPNVQYYDTVASGDQESINSDSEAECDAAKAERDANTAGDSASENSLQQSSPEENRRDGRNVSDRKHNIEFEHIPDPVELKKRSSSSSSDSSLSDKVFNEDQRPQRDPTTPKSQLTEESVQQRADFKAARKVEVPQMSIEGSEIPGFTSEPFADWSPHRKDPNLTDPDLWQETEEQFEFSDQSSIRGSFNDSKLTVAPTSDKQKRNMSSSSSSVSEDEITEYTVNSDQEEQEKNIDRNHNKPDITNAYHKQDASFQQKIYGVDPIMPSVGLNQGDYRYDTETRTVRPKLSASSHSSDSDGEDYTVKQEKDKGNGKEKSLGVSDRLSSKIVTREGDTMKKVEPMPRTKWPVPSLVIKSQDKSLDTRTSSPPAAYSSSSSSESEADIADLKMEQNTSRVNVGIKINQPGMLSTDLDRQCIPQIKRCSNVNAPSSASDSTSSVESADETTKHLKRQEKGDVDMAGLPTKEHQSLNYDYLNPPRPSQNLGHVTPIKMHMDIRAQSPPPDSSSSSEDETTHYRKKQEQGQVPMARLPIKVSQTVRHDPQTQWPLIDLEHTIQVKRRLDIKAPLQASESSSSSDSEDETTHHTERPGKVGTAGLPFQESQAEHKDREIRWPALDLEHTTGIKRRLDIKAPSPLLDSSSSSDSEDETTGHTEKQEQEQVNMARLPIKVSQTVSHDPKTQWPLVDLEHTTKVTRRLDIKAPLQASELSSSSDSEDETTHHTERSGKMDTAGLPFQESQAKHHDPEIQWPALSLEHTTGIKRRLDIKAPSPPPDSSSSSDSEDQTTSHKEKQEQGQVHMAKLPVKVSQTVSHDPQTQWPLVDLLDIKAPSQASELSSSSDSEDETTHPTVRPGKVGIAGPPFQESQARHDRQWPALNLENTTSIKRHLDIKASLSHSSSSDSEDEIHHTKKERPELGTSVRLTFQESQKASHDPDTHLKRHVDIKTPSPASDSSSSSVSEDEATYHIKKQEQGKTDIARVVVSQTLDLGNMTRIKRRLDIKAPSPASDSSSSSDSEDETAHHIKKQEQGKADMIRVPINVSQTLSDVPQTQWPALDLEHTTRIKRRLDIKAPSPDSNSSSSSHSEDETGHLDKQRPGKVGTAGLQFQKSQRESHDPDTQWPTLDLEHTTTHIKRHLDIKAPSPASDSSSSSDSEDEATHHTKMEKAELVGIVGHPFQESQTKSHDPETQWPAVDLGNLTRIKRRLDIKAPSPASDSSSSSDSEDETTHHIKKQEQGKADMTRVPINVSQTLSDVPQTQWPALDLEHTTRIKRRLDIKAPSPASDSSSSSDSEDEATHHTKMEKAELVGIAGHPFQESQTKSHDQETQWPALDLGNKTRIKRRLDIKAPSPASDSSSSSDSEDEATHHTKMEKAELVGIVGHPFQESQTKSHDPETQWPAVDLHKITRIKRRLDIKAPSPASDSSTSSDSEDETAHHTKKEKAELVRTAGHTFQEFQTKSHDPETQWPAVDLGNMTRIKRRLDIKAPSPASDSSSSSDSEDETTHHIKKQEQGKADMTRVPINVSQTLSDVPQTQWPALDLEHTTRIKRRLDIKAPSPASDSSSSSDSEDEATHHTKMEKAELVGIAGHPFQESQTKSHDQETQWPAVDLGNMTHIKRRLDIKAPSPASDSSSSSDSEDEATHHTKESPKLVEIAGLLFQKSQTVRHDTETQWPAIDLGNNTHIKRRLDIKVPSSSPDSLLIGGSEIHTAEGKSSSSSSSDEQGEGMEDLSNPVEPDPDSRWLQLGLSSALHVKRRLDIKAPSPQPDPILSSVSPGYQQSELNSSSSDCEDENRNHAKLGVSAISKTSRSPKTPVIKTSHSLNTDHYIKLEKYTVTTDEVGDKMTSDNIMATPLINPELESRWATMNLGISRFRKRLEITSHTPPEPPNLPLSPPPDSFSSSSSEKETGSQSSRTRQKRKGIAMQGIIQRESSLTPKNKPVVKERLRKDYSLTKTKEKSNIPNTRRSLDIKREASSSSSENDTMDHSVPDLSLGVPRVKTNLNAKAPLPGSSNSSSSSSESENEVTGDSAKQSRHASNMSGMTEDSMITYKRVIFKPSSPTTDDTNQRHTGVEMITVAHQSPSHGAGGSNASLAPRRVPSMSFDDVVKNRIEQSKRTTNVDVPPEIMWTGLGGQLPDLSVSSPRRQLDVGLSTSQRAPPSDSLASIRALNTFENSFRSTNEGAVPEDRRERKGLSALKAMSSERRKWDTQDENLVTDLLDGIPHYRRHDIGGTEPLQQAPPPIRATPPPFEAVELKRNSPQSNKKQGSDGTRYNIQQESDPSSIMSPNMSVYFESSNISHV